MKKLMIIAGLLMLAPKWLPAADFYEDTKNYLFSSISVGYETRHDAQGAQHLGVLNVPLFAYGDIKLDPLFSFDSRIREIGASVSYKINDKYNISGSIFNDSRFDGTGGSFKFTAKLR